MRTIKLLSALVLISSTGAQDLTDYVLPFVSYCIDTPILLLIFQRLPLDRLGQRRQYISWRQLAPRHNQAWPRLVYW
jgi:hypothetical protein